MVVETSTQPQMGCNYNFNVRPSLQVHSNKNLIIKAHAYIVDPRWDAFIRIASGYYYLWICLTDWPHRVWVLYTQRQFV